jgi:hypothetical protein
LVNTYNLRKSHFPSLFEARPRYSLDIHDSNYWSSCKKSYVTYTLQGPALVFHNRTMPRTSEAKDFDVMVITGLPHRKVERRDPDDFVLDFKKDKIPTARQDRRAERIQKYIHEVVVTTWWRTQGYSVQVYQFGWFRQGSFEQGMEAFDKAVSRHRRPLRVIAESAGTLEGVVGLRRHPNKIERLLAIAGPLSIPPEASARYWDQPRIPKVMHEAYLQADESFRTAPAEQLAKITALYGPGDEHVPNAWSQRPEIDSYKLPRGTHSSILLGALSIHSHHTKALLYQ